ncbi:MAG TPA: peptide chain release factor N(5)-glutamine methyltransferase, partial [Actinomycetes bacterium]|nr:peptide chain release factor N(5)-glutamine methyltransferase [Actinomycetes bacterium]
GVTTAAPDVGRRRELRDWATRELAAAGCVSARAEADWLLEEAVDEESLRAMVARRVAGEPLQYVIGWAPFGPLRLVVGPGVFVPRPETEGLADRAATRLRSRPELPEGSGEPRGGARVRPIAVDVCTGSGAIACFLAAEVPGARVLATELDPGALAWARCNADRYGVELLAGDLDEPLPAALAGRVDVLCANVPYVPSGAIATLPTDVRDHEPRLALDGGPDGLDVLRRLVARAGHWLAPGGGLLCEIGEDQAETGVALLTAAGLVEVAVHPDLVGRDRILEGTRP